MAVKIYRFQYEGPNAAQLGRTVPGAASVGVVIGSTPARDWTFDDTQTDETDLIEGLGEWGWVFVEDVTP